MKINKIYRAISGEVGSLIPQGTACLIIRTQGCNLNCSFCDAPETQNRKLGEDFDVKELMDLIKKEELPVLLTGGEPFMQLESRTLIIECSRIGIDIQVETNGSLQHRDLLDIPHVSLIIDAKPGAAMDVVNSNSTPTSLYTDGRHWLKFLVMNAFQVDLAIHKIRYMQQCGIRLQYAISAVVNSKTTAYEGDHLPGYITEQLIAKKVRATLNIQMHKLLQLP